LKKKKQEEISSWKWFVALSLKEKFVEVMSLLVAASASAMILLGGLTAFAYITFEMGIVINLSWFLFWSLSIFFPMYWYADSVKLRAEVKRLGNN